MASGPEKRNEERRDLWEKRRQSKKRAEKRLVLLILIIILVIIALVSFSTRKTKTKSENKGQANEKAQLDTEKSSLEISLLGDICFGSSSGKERPFEKAWQDHEPKYFLEKVSPYLESSDAVVADLKNVFTKENQKEVDKSDPYKAYNDQYLDFFKEANIKYLNVVNVNMGDYGQAGFNDTTQILEKNGIKPFGSHTEKTSSPSIGSFTYDKTQIIEKDGLKVGLMGIMANDSSKPSQDMIDEKIKGLKDQGCHYIIASLAGPGERGSSISQVQKDYGHLLIDRGCDLVFGHGSHKIQAMEEYKGKRIYYDLGNFFFIDYADYVEDPLSYMIKIKINREGEDLIVNIDEIPLRWSGPGEKNSYQPMPSTDQEDIDQAISLLHPEKVSAKNVGSKNDLDKTETEKDKSQGEDDMKGESEEGLEGAEEKSSEE